MFSSLTTLFRSRPKALKASRPAPSTRLNLEHLEARITPSHSHGSSLTVIVNSFNTVVISKGSNGNEVYIGDIILSGSGGSKSES